MTKGRDSRSTRRPMSCPACGGHLAEAARAADGGRERIARCLYCNAEYDRGSDVYYRFFNDPVFHPAESLLFAQGIRGKIGGHTCEITGRVRYAQVGAKGLRTRDEWHARTEEGERLVFVERDDMVLLYEPYDKPVPPAVLKRGGGRGNNARARGAARLERILYIEGTTGEKRGPGTLYETLEKEKSGSWFLVRSTGGSAVVMKGRLLSLSDIVGGFRCEPQIFSLQETRRKRKNARACAAVYLCAMLAAALLTALSLRAGKVSGGLNETKYLLGQRTIDAAAGFRFEQALYGPFEIKGNRTLCGLDLEEADGSAVKGYTLYYRMVLLREKAVSGFLPLQRGRTGLLKTYLEESSSLKEPVESYIREGAFTAGSGQGLPGIIQLNRGYARFVVDEPGAYYVYLEACGARDGMLESIRLTGKTGLGVSMYFALALLVFLVLCAVWLARLRAYRSWPATGRAGT